MKARKKSILIIICLVAAALIAFLLCLCSGKKDQIIDPDTIFEEEYKSSYELLTMIIEHDEAYFDEGEFEDYLADLSNLENLQRDYPAYADFILGMEAVHNDEDDSVQYLNSCLSELGLPYYEDYCDEATLTNSQEKLTQNSLSIIAGNVAARCYYELSRICINNEYYDIAESYHDLMNSVINTESSLNEYVYLNTWVSYDVEEVPNGTEKAIEILNGLYSVADEHDYEEPEIILMALAEAYGNQGNSVKFVTTELKALDLVTEKGDVENQVLINSSIGLEYLDENNLDKAREYMEDAYALEYKDDADTEYYLKTYVCSNLALIDIRSGEYDEALQYMEEAEDYREKQTDVTSARDDKANLLTLWAEYEIAMNNPENAIEYLDEAYDIFNSANSFSYSSFELEVNILYGQACLELNDGKKALEYYKLAEQDCTDTGKDVDTRCYQGLYYAYKMLGNNQQAFNYAEKYADSLTEEIYDSQEDEAAYLLEEFQSDEKDSQISELSNRSKLYLVITMFSIVVVAFIIFGFYGNIRASRRIRRLNDDLLVLSEHDGLTGLYNRRKLDSYLSAKWDEMLDSSQCVAVAMIDVDFFKLYNDFYGHQKGDSTLISVSNVLKSVTDKSLENLENSFAARYGGEEFLLIMPGKNKVDMEQVLLKIREEIKALNIPHEKSTVADNVTLSIGCFVIEKDVDKVNPQINYEAAISLADGALYEAKKERNTYVLKD